ncbi:MAG: hypothetical protein Q9188_004570 [Gyalolechia gomerana]
MAKYNFCFPVRELSNDKIKLAPFNTSTHATEFLTLSSPHPSLYAHITRGPYASVEDFLTNFIHPVIDPDPACQLYAIIDKTRSTSQPTNDPSGALAGVIAYLSSSAQHLSTEIGFVIVLPAFQRTHVTSNAILLNKGDWGLEECNGTRIA